MGHVQVVSTNHRVTGSTVTWRVVASGEALQPMGVKSLEQIAEAIVRDGLIVRFTLTVIGQKP
jgi:hypothetical protein